MKFGNQKGTRPAVAGFTLIELLVVIAIIAILSTIILAALGNAKKRAVNAKIIAEVREMGKTAEFFYLDNNSYGTPQTFSWGPNLLNSGSFPNSIFNTSLPNSLAPLVRRVGNLNGNFISGRSTGQAWAFAAWLPYYQEVYCIDSNGTEKFSGVAPYSATNRGDLLSVAFHQQKGYCCRVVVSGVANCARD